MKIMTIRYTKNYIASLFFLTLIGCDSNDPVGPNNCDVNWAEYTSAEVEDVNEKARAFAENPNTANCSAFRTSYLTYKEALEEASICLNALQEAAYQQALADAEEAIQELECSEFGS